MNKSLTLIVALWCSVAWADEPQAKPPMLSVAPFSGQRPMPFSDSPIVVAGSEFELIVLDNYTGIVTWYVEGKSPPITMIEPKAKSTVIGIRSGQQKPGQYDVPEKPCVVVYPAGDGQVTLVALGVQDGAAKVLASIQITANRGAQPPPKPVDPLPDDSHNPLPASRLSVLITNDPDKTLTAKQTGIINSSNVRDAIEKAGGTWRKWSYKDDSSGEPQWWKDAHARAKEKKQPWVIISSPKGFYEGMPESEADFIAKVNKLGG